MISHEIEKGIHHIAKNDARLAKIIESRSKIQLKPHKDYFESLIESIIGQQLSMKAAQSIINKFYAHFSKLPIPAVIIETEDEFMRTLGLSWAKIKYVKDLCLKVQNNELTFKNLNKKSDAEITQELIKVKGIGIWTAQMFLIFTLGRLNVLPTNDLGIRKAIMNVYKLKELPDEKKIVSIANKNKWDPYNTIASLYLWKSLDEKAIIG